MLNIKVFTVLCIFILGAKVFQNIREYYKPLPRPKFPLDEWWGEGNKPIDWPGYLSNTSEIISNRLMYAQKTIDNLRKRLNETCKIADPLEDAVDGLDVNSLNQLISYWRDDYLPRWRGRELSLWQFNHLTTEIQGLRIHFLNLKTYEERKINKTHYPVLLLHGWPSTVLEFYPLINKLHLSEEDFDSPYIFDVIAPSLPSTAWSQGTSKKGLGPAQIAVVIRNLMLKLGYRQFFIYGSSIGGHIGSHIASIFPENVIGYHSSLCVDFSIKSLVKGALMSLVPRIFTSAPSYYKPLQISMLQKLKSIIAESADYHFLTTKPDTLGSALTDNPIGLAGYLLEIYTLWTNIDYKTIIKEASTENPKLDVFLDTTMIYYLTNSILTSQRLFAELFSSVTYNLEHTHTTVPMACSHFEGDLNLFQFFDSQLTYKYPNLIQSKYYNGGGHFPALELPNVIYDDFIEFVKKVETYYQNEW